MNKKQRRDKRVEERMAYWAEKRPNWLKEPVARVEGALKFIMGKIGSSVVKNAKGDWVMMGSPVADEAREYARLGNGVAVNKLALRVLAHGK